MGKKATTANRTGMGKTQTSSAICPVPVPKRLATPIADATRRDETARDRAQVHRAQTVSAVLAPIAWQARARDTDLPQDMISGLASRSISEGSTTSRYSRINRLNSLIGFRVLTQQMPSPSVVQASVTWAHRCPRPLRDLVVDPQQLLHQTRSFPIGDEVRVHVDRRLTQASHLLPPPEPGHPFYQSKAIHSFISWQTNRRQTQFLIHAFSRPDLQVIDKFFWQYVSLRTRDSPTRLSMAHGVLACTGVDPLGDGPNHTRETFRTSCRDHVPRLFSQKQVCTSAIAWLTQVMTGAGIIPISYSMLDQRDI